MTTPPIADTPTLLDHVRRVAELREGLATQQVHLKLVQQEFDFAHAGLIAGVALRAAVLATAEADLRAAALERFSATEDKHPAPGVTIRVQTRVTYDRDQALAWAKAKGVALTLDAKAFEGLAKHDRSLPASVVEDPQATIARDLRTALAEAEDAGRVV
jgi:hypothetical protein